MAINRENFKSWLKRNDIVPKIVSIMLAVILWGYIADSKTGELKFKLQINYKNLDKALTVADISEKTAVLRVRGKQEELKNISSKNFKLFIDLSSVKVGDYANLKIQAEKTDIAEEVELDISPSDLKVLVERKISRSVPIVPRYSGETEKGYIMGRIKAIPEYVVISGAAKLLSQIDFVPTEYIFLNNRNESFNSKVRLEKVSDDVEYSFSEVSVSIPIWPVSERRLVEVPISLRNRIKGFNYILSDEKVKISYISLKGRDLSPNELLLYVDASELLINNEELIEKGFSEVKGFIHVKNLSEDDAGIVAVAPERVSIKIIKEGNDR